MRHFLLTRFKSFNPRSREGSDSDSHSSTRLLLSFNPRSREGSDSLCLTISYSMFKYSTCANLTWIDAKLTGRYKL